MKDLAPTLEINLKKISQQYRQLQRNLGDYKIFYAVKANPEKEVLKTLKQAGSSFEIASIGELQRLIAIGVNAEDVIFSNPVKIPAHIEQAYQAGVRYFAFDCKEELYKIADLAPGSNVYLRMNVSNAGSQIKLSAKFGCNKSDAVDLLAHAKSLNLKPVGISFHVGSQAEDNSAWGRAINDVCDVMKELASHNITLDVINIGGGFPVSYGKAVPGIVDIAHELREAVNRLPYEVDLWCEPGRYLVAEAGTIHANVIGKTTRKQELWLFLDIGRFQSFIEMFESEDIRYPVSYKVKTRNLQKYTLTGPTCDSYDTIMYGVMLPEDISVGDQVSFSMCGAYTHVYGAPFNDFSLPRIVYK